MSHFVYKLILPRPTFDRDMSDDEGGVMSRRADYPAVKSGMCTFDVFPMPVAIVRP